MARSRSSRTLTNLYGWAATAATLVAGAGVSGWAMPDLPVVGPTVQQLLGKAAALSPVKPAASDAARSADAGVAPSVAAEAVADLPTTAGTAESPALGAVAADMPKPRSPLSPFARPKPNSAAGSAAPVPKASATVETRNESPLPPAGAGPGRTVSTAAAVPPASPANPAASNPAAAAPASTITIASFNIQVFGTSKLANERVREILVHTVRQFDLVAIQEVRSKDDSVIPSFVRDINSDGSRYDYIIGPRLGRTNSKEQYTFVFNTQRLEASRSSVVTLNDPEDLLHREPLVARFRAVATPPETGFSFWIVNIHTDPDEVPQEVDALADAFEAVMHAAPDEDDVILLGDLNADETQFGRLGKIPGITWIVPRTTTTNTRGNRTYDNILFLEDSTTEFTGRWGVVDMQRAFNLTLDEALKVSDHLPVWAEFDVRESSRVNFARRPAAASR
ncbi:MAG: endonuclease/exonuclease/phosphatase family protein [Pirellulales bacterium]